MKRRNTRLEPVSVLLTRRALADIREIDRYSTKEWGRKTAEQYLDAIQAALDRLPENPELLRLEPDFSPSLYFYRVRKHFLVCDYREKTVCVLAVIHTSMDVPARLNELEPRLAMEADYLHRKLHRESIK